VAEFAVALHRGRGARLEILADGLVDVTQQQVGVGWL